MLCRLSTFVSECVLPLEETLIAYAEDPATKWSVHPQQLELQREAQRRGLWNLWISPGLALAMRRDGFGGSGHDPDPDARRASPTTSFPTPFPSRLLFGAGLTNLEYAFCAEILGQSPFASEAVNCSAPDTGNMEVLGRYGSLAQRQRWLLPLLRGEIRSCFAMTEPAVASSDATNIQCHIHIPHRATGSGTPATAAASSDHEVVVHGTKWWISGRLTPDAPLASSWVNPKFVHHHRHRHHHHHCLYHHHHHHHHHHISSRVS